MKRDTPAVLQQWLSGIRIEQISHLRAAARYDHLHRILGLLVTVFSVVVGTSIFGTLGGSQNQKVLISIGVVSMVSAILSGLQTFLNLGQLGAMHRTAGNKFGKLRRQVEEIVALDENDPETSMKEIREQWDTLSEESPVVPQRFVDAAIKIVSRGHSKDQTADAKS